MTSPPGELTQVQRDILRWYNIPPWMVGLGPPSPPPPRWLRRLRRLKRAWLEFTRQW